MNRSEFIASNRFAWSDLKHPLYHGRHLLRQGLSPQGFSLAVAVGITIGILPTLWGTSLLCGLLAWRLDLNQLVVQSFNYLVYPLQISMFVPFALWGQLLCPHWFEATRPLSMHNLQHDWTALGSLLLPAQLAALVGWVSMAPLFLLAGYGLSFCLAKAWGAVQ
ncbi:MAG: DUF2062 domain-containing protein [Desulfuromonadales bacterium]|nr:DUF2062 domain-containing protein [Desulfuromonadales bacterium]